MTDAVAAAGAAIDDIVLNDWYPAARSDALPDGGLLSVTLLGEDLVLWRAGGQVAAWRDLCIHRGTRLSLGRVEAGLLVCPYHGWRYDTAGRCVQIPAHPEQHPPAKGCARTYAVTECYGLIWVSLGQPAAGVPDFLEEADPTYRKILCGPSDVVQAGAARIIENFLDVAHLAHVHAGLLGDAAHSDVPDYTVESGPEGIIASDIRIYQPDAYGAGVGDYVAYTYRVLRPFVAYLAKDTASGARFTLAVFLTPHTERQTTAWFYMGANPQIDTPEDAMIAYQNAIFNQDRPIVESQRPHLLPLDLQAELHLRSDRTALAYRKWLRELGVRFGTAKRLI
jgi:phenylpropionate dioxygenase-like ring-hydroxylating dioxygenase large terminal subunit